MSTNTIGSRFSAATAEIWDECYQDLAGDEVAFYLQQFGASKPLDGPTLDVGCGTGRFLLPLLKRGYSGMGIDVSIEMLNVLRKKAASSGMHPELEHCSLDDFKYSGGFSGIVAFYVVFYILKTEEIRDFFAKAYQLLSPGGILLFNYYNAFELWEPRQWFYRSTFTYGGGVRRIEYEYTPVDQLRGVVDMQDYRMVTQEGAVHADCCLRPVRFYTMTEVTLLLEAVGFADIRTYAGLGGSAVTDESRRGYALYTTAKKL